MEEAAACDFLSSRQGRRKRVGGHQLRGGTSSTLLTAETCRLLLVGVSHLYHRGISAAQVAPAAPGPCGGAVAHPGLRWDYRLLTQAVSNMSPTLRPEHMLAHARRAHVLAGCSHLPLSHVEAEWKQQARRRQRTGANAQHTRAHVHGQVWTWGR